MGSCLSSSKIIGSSSRSGAGYVAVKNHRSEPTKPISNTTTATNKNRDAKAKPRSQLGRNRRPGMTPCGKRTDFGYAKDFDRRYTVGKLLGHGQFGYTYVATDKSTGDRVAVKKIDKNKGFD